MPGLVTQLGTAIVGPLWLGVPRGGSSGCWLKGAGILPLPSPVGVVEVVGVADDAEGVVEVVLDDAPARAVGERALQVLRSFPNTKPVTKTHRTTHRPAACAFTKLNLA